ncbi:hypothetical protein ABPG77_010075 [Micractinium sp. CCAP 211/92]
MALGSRQLALACIEAGALPRLAERARAVDEASHSRSVAALRSLALTCSEETAACQSVIPALVHVAGSNADASTLIDAAQGLRCLDGASPQRNQAIMQASGADALQLLQKHTDPGVREHAARALAQLRMTAQLQAAALTCMAAAAAACSAECVTSQHRVCAAEGCVATKGLKLCARCGTVRYCSPECQASHWAVHRRTCKRA